MSELPGALWRDETPYLLGAALVLAAVLHRALVTERKTLRHTLLLFLFWLALDGLAALFAARQQAAFASGLHQLALLGLGLALIRLSGLVLFRVVLPWLHVRPPRIVEDIVVIGGYLLWAMIRLSYAGVELSSLVATSAVITAVLAFAMQDTLGNILGGLALQLDNSLQIGDWVRVDDVSGRVVEIQWRFTAVLTRNGEKVVIPNAYLMKAKFAVLADPDMGVTGWRRWVGFEIDYGVSPAQVIEVAQKAVTDGAIANVAASPPPSCVAMAFESGAVRYALRYWLVDPREDDATDSAVRMHLLAAVQRNGWRMAAPDQTVHLVEDSAAHREWVRQRELERRLRALGGVEIFATLDEGERRRIAERLVHAPFAPGDVITRQGAEAHWLYLLVRGEADVFWEAPGGERRLLSRLGPGSLFGEMGLLTGAPRASTVVAVGDAECYRLDKAGFHDVIHERPELAEALAQVLAQRRLEMEGLQTEFRRERSAQEHAQHRADLLERIRGFFGLSG